MDAAPSSRPRPLFLVEWRAEELGAMLTGRNAPNHTLRHSYARHLLLYGVPINYL